MTFAEDIATLTSLGEFTVLSNGATVRKVYELCRRERFQVLHFVTNTAPALDEAGRFKRVIMLHDEELTVQDLIQLSSAAGNAGLVLNTCASAGLAVEAVRGGVPWTLFTTVDIPVEDAWLGPEQFYTAWRRMEDNREPIDLGRAYLSTPDDGRYGWLENQATRQSAELVAVAQHVANLTVSIEDLNRKMEVITRQTRPRDLVIIGVLLFIFFSIQMFNTVVNIRQIQDVNGIQHWIIQHINDEPP